MIQPKFFQSLRFRLLATVSAVTMISSLVVEYVVRKPLTDLIYEEYRSKAQALVNSLATSTQDTILSRDVSTIQGFIDEYKSIAGVAFIYVEDEKGKVIAHTFSPTFPPELTSESQIFIAFEAIGKSQIKERILLISGKRRLEVTKPILGGLLGVAHVGMDLERIESTIGLATKKGLIFGLLLAAIGMLIDLAILTFVVRKIRHLIAIMLKVVHGGDLDQTVPNFGRDEIGSLAQVFNSLLQEVKKGRINLESKVAARTEQLTASNMHLNATITDLENARMSLISSSKLAALGEMAGGIAHEINNPLAIIDGSARMLAVIIKRDKVDSEKVDRIVGTIEATVVRISRIVCGLRSFARDGANDPMEVTSVASLVEHSLALCNERFKAHSIELVIGAIDPGLMVNCRATQLEQVLLNLLSNAHDAVEALALKWVKVEVHDLHQKVEITITDSGKGIPHEIREKIMQPFFTTKSIGKGTGLGLSLSKGIVEAHGGCLSLDAKCENTRFVIQVDKQPEATALKRAS